MRRVNAEALVRYQELPFPDTTEEHWRFTDLRVFDLDAFQTRSGIVPGHVPAETMLDLDVVGLVMISESGVSVECVFDGIMFQWFDEVHECFYLLVGWDEKFVVYNAVVWQHDLLV